ncbi:MAG: PDZ domain-containing protein [Planctomycetota bacterium]|nr:MAG: PDZ domain-containing protein [Planctomycetota bacterium]
MRAFVLTLTAGLLLSAAPCARAQGEVSNAPTAAPPEALTAARAEEEALVALIERVSQAFVAIGGGSGVIISPEGEIITNDHVAGSREVGQQWTVIQPGGRFRQATLVAKDPRGDIALLKMVQPGPYPYVPLGDSDALEVGQRVLALGNPFGFSKNGTPHASVGVISALHRYQGGYSDAIQTDTPINPGNSGGPLIDMQGRLVGINGRIAVRFGTRANTGVGYAIPANQIRAFLPTLRAGGVVSHGKIEGLSLREAPGAGGAMVRAVRPGSSAARAGLREGDLIVAAGGRPVSSPRRFQGIVGTLPAGAPLPIRVRRGEEELEVSVELSPRDRRLITKGAYMGVVLAPGEGGAEIEEVVAGSPAATAGLQTGDVIRLIDGQRVRNARTVVDYVATKTPGTKITLTVLRGEANLEIELILGKRGS